MFNLIKTCFITFFLLLTCLYSRDVTLDWDANLDTEWVTEYRVYRVLDNNTQTHIATVTDTTATVNVETGWFIAVTAFNSLESSLSQAIIIPIGPPPPTYYSIVGVSSQEETQGDFQIAFAFDNSYNTWWQSANGVPYPHSIVVDLGREFDVGGVVYLPVSDGIIRQFKIYVSNDTTNWGTASGGSFNATNQQQTFLIKKKRGRYVLFKAFNSIDGSNSAKISELSFILTEARQTPSSPTGLRLR